MPTFGRKNAQRQQERQANGGGNSAQGGYWIKNFRDDETQVRFLWDDPENEFIEIAEHFDNIRKISFPCAKHEGSSVCVGCDYPAPDPDNEQDLETRLTQTRGQWVFPLLDDKGYPQVYKIGWKLFKKLGETYELLDTLIDRDFIVTRDQPGGPLTTEYGLRKTSDTSTKTPKAPIPTVEQISDILGKKYFEAAAKYAELGIITLDHEEAPIQDPDPVPQDDAPAARKAVAKKVAAKAEPKPAPAESTGKFPDDPDAIGPAQPDLANETLASAKAAAAKKAQKLPPKKATPAPVADPAPEPDEAQNISLEPIDAQESSSTELKAWLDELGEEYSDRATRSQLATIVEGIQQANAA